MSQKVIFASDYRGVALREILVDKFQKLGSYNVIDIGIPSGSLLDYIDISKQLAEELRTNPQAIGVISCGSGQGVAIALNRYTHIRACVCRTLEDALRVREKLNANVICLGSKHNTPEESFLIVETFCNTSFKGGEHEPCVKKLDVNTTQHSKDGVNLIVRAIIIHENHILLTTATESNRDFAQNLYFLPGGHVDYNESSLEALHREIWEEMNLNIESSKYKGILECSWNRKGSIYHEINLVYKVKIKALDLKNPPISVDHSFQRFVWHPITALNNITILPQFLKPIIQNAINEETEQHIYYQMLDRENIAV